MGSSSPLPPEFELGVVTPVHQGDCVVSDSAEQIYSTVLGSCISACIYDRMANVGGMNHFLLAQQSGSARDRYGASARYGAFAMEQLINMVLTRGSGRKANLDVKVFGGGKINASLDDVGRKNIHFVRQFLADEGYGVASEDLGGAFARRVLFKPASGRVLIKRLDSDAGRSVAREEAALVQLRAMTREIRNDIELF